MKSFDSIEYLNRKIGIIGSPKKIQIELLK